MDWNVWGAPIAVMAVGVTAGLVLALLSRGQQRRDREAEAWALKESLVDQLRSLRADREKLQPDDYTARFGQMLDRAARALRDAEAAGNEPEPTPTPEPVKRDVNWGRRAAWAVAVLVFFVALGAALQTSSSTRGKDGIMTGGDRIGPTAIAVEIEQLTEKVNEDPNDIDSINRLAYIAIQQGELGSAMAWMDKAKAIAADHPEVRTHLAILQASVGMAERAKTELAAALKLDPTLSKAHLWMGMIELQNGNRTASIPSLEAALEHASTPEDRTMASRALSEARRPPPTVKLQGSIALAPGSTAPKSGVLFVMVRNAAEGGGPPVAAVRLDPRGIPGTYRVTDRDLMMGGAWPEQVWVEARIDSDGNPSTKEASDLIAARVGPFAPEATDAALVLGGGSAPPATDETTAANLSGTLIASPGTTLPATGAVFVIVRRTPTPQGPPVAAVRLPTSAVPGPFSVSDADIMMGGAWPEQVWVQVRADSDGNAMTKDASDAESAVMGPFEPQTSGIELTLGN
jgi:cytochrome c-type biogenesis protein CcmH/NrfG